MDRGGRSNGTSGSRDIYTQLINNDMVKELDDIEAISQQISQHAEVLYNSWKNNGMTQNPVQQYKLSSAQSVSPSLDETSNPLSRDLRERGGTSSPRIENGGVPNRNQAPFNSIPAGYRNGDKGLGIKFPSETYGSLDRQNSSGRPQPTFSTNSLDRHSSYPDRNPSFSRNSNSSSPHNSSVSSPTSSTRESPSKGSSITHISPSSPTDVGPLELLASPNLSGNLEELVTSFVSTDRAKQAARNTISSTIMRRLGSPNGSSSPVRSPSPTPTLTYRGASPLRSPMLTNSIRAVNSSDPMSPNPSNVNMFPSDIIIPMSGTSSTLNDFIHSPMQSIFSKDNGRMSPSIQSPMIQSLSQKSPMIQSPVIHSQMIQSPGFKSPSSPSSHIQKSPSVQSPNLKSFFDQPDSIPIPVKVISSPSSSQGLKSPSVLQNVHKTPFQFPLEKPVIDHEPMPNLFDQFGTVKDPDENILAMRRRFEEAKQRMALSLPAREGGLRPNSLIARSMFDSDKFSPWNDDASSFLLEQLRRRNKRRMETPAAPHPELTPQQKQHIFERSSTPSTLQPGAPMRRMLPGGSVAERVLMFEKSPSLFGLDPGQTRVLPVRREPTLTGTALTPWRSQTHENQNKQVGLTIIN